jgi:hypothetical protein
MAATETGRFTSKSNVPWIVVACLFVLAIAIAGGWAFGYFFFPFFLLTAMVWLFYRVLRRVSVRNPLYDPTPDSAHKWADGQPLGRSNRFEMEKSEMARQDARFQAEKEEELRRIDEECREEATHHRPDDYEGPPPVVPFP